MTTGQPAGFGVDEPLETLSSRPALPPAFAALRGELEPSLVRLRDSREDGWTS